MDFTNIVSKGLAYHDFLAKFGTPPQRDRWEATYQRISLTVPQRELLASFKREMPVLVLSGAWCGDCIDQCPIFERFAAANPLIKTRYFDRDESADLAGELKVCGGARVPVVVFLSEDLFEVGRYGDKTLAKYRNLHTQSTGESCSTGLGGDAALEAAVVQEWLDQFERAQLILRLSARLRTKHGD